MSTDKLDHDNSSGESFATRAEYLELLHGLRRTRKRAEQAEQRARIAEQRAEDAEARLRELLGVDGDHPKETGSWPPEIGGEQT